MPGTSVILDSLWILKGALNAHIGKFHLNDIFIFMHRPVL